MNEERCETCRFWVPYSPVSDAIGWCQRYPPFIRVYNEANKKHYDVSPTTETSDWCGEYQRKPLPVAKEPEADPLATAISDYWLAHYVRKGICSLCANSGFVDTRDKYSTRTGRVEYCFCPNGQDMRSRKAAEEVPVDG